MSELSDALPQLDEPGDAELISAVRGGDTQAYGMLFARHVDAARRLARQLVSSGDVDDLVSEAFAKVLGVLQRGGGPDLAFRAYLLTSIRRLHVDKLRAGARLQTTDDLTPYDPGVPFEDTAVSGFENATAARAFASLPERWRQVLWHTEVEGQKPADIAPLLGMTANSVSALAYRAREGLREAFVSMHAQDALEDACATTRAGLGAYIRGGSSKRDAAKVEAHLKECRECSGIYLELAEVNSNLGAVLAPLLLGSAGAGYLAAAHAGAAVAAKGGIVLLFDRARDWVLHNPAGRATAGTAAAAVAAVAVAAGVQAVRGPEAAPSAAPSISATTSPATPPPAAAPPAAPTGPSVPPPAVVAVPPAIAAAKPVTTAATPATPAVPAAAALKQSAPVISVPLPAVALQPGADSVTIDLTRGATDPNGDRLSVASATISGPTPHGTVVIGHAPSARALVGIDSAAVLARKAAGPTTVVYTPQAAWRGTETIAYTLTDGHGGAVRGTVDVTTPNKGPVAAGDHRELHADYADHPAATAIVVLANDTDPNGDTLTVTSVGAVSGDAGGSVALTGGTVSYTPGTWHFADTQDRTDTFTYLVSDGHGGAATGTVTIVVGLTPNRAPVAPDLSITTHWSTTGSVSSSASDADGDRLSYAVTDGAHGHVTESGGVLRYDPLGATLAADSFTYTVSDGKESATGTVSVTLTNDHAPDVDDSTLAIGDGEDAVVHVPAATDGDGDPVTVTVLDDSGTFDPDARTITWSSPYGHDSEHTIRYSVSDGLGTDSATVSVRAEAPRSTLSLTDHHEAASSADSANHLRLTGLPDGRRSTVTVDVTGWTSWVGFHVAEGSGNHCTESSTGAGSWRLVCTVVTEGDFLHLDFDHGAAWSLTATAVADDFVADDVSLARP